MTVASLVHRWVAACACAWLIVCGALDAHHVASVGHVRRPGGTVVHTATHAEPREHHDERRAGIRPATETSADGACTRMHAVIATVSPTGVDTSPALPPTALVVRAAGAPAAAPNRLLLIAPKTSPPARS